ncbi:MAG: iron-containing alcohol dehydrogenase, partial [Clostridia bacterium]|nr:iron-containing alcohol dehydrogenase [Clostridia bacterium]
TAPSMDGYASASSSMERDGLKVSLSTVCPNVILGDTDVLKNAPLPMLRSGLGDMLAKYVSICEWRLSQVINGEYYCEFVAELVRESLAKCVSNAQGLMAREEKAVEAVFEGLVVSGLAMAFAGVSRPASGCEHYFSHVWDMRSLEFGTPCESHGTQCALATLLCVRMYEELKNAVPDSKKALDFVHSFDMDRHRVFLREFLGKGAEAMIAQEEKEKKYDPDRHACRIEAIIENFPLLKDIIEEELPSSADLEALMTSVGLPVSPEEIGLGGELEKVFAATKDIRDKYVLSRLVWDLGLDITPKA